MWQLILKWLEFKLHICKWECIKEERISTYSNHAKEGDLPIQIKYTRIDKCSACGKVKHHQVIL